MVVFMKEDYQNLQEKVKDFINIRMEMSIKGHGKTIKKKKEVKYNDIFREICIQKWRYLRRRI